MMPEGDQDQTGVEEEGENAKSLVPDVAISCSSGQNMPAVELEDFSQTSDAIQEFMNNSNIVFENSPGFNEPKESGLVETAKVPEPLTLKGLDLDTHDVLDSGAFIFNTNLCSDALSEDDSSSLEKTNHVNFSELESDSTMDLHISDGNQENPLEENAKSPNCGSSPTLADGSPAVYQVRDSIDVRWDDSDNDDDQRSILSRQSMKDGMCCCYQTFHRACLRCVEETPAMLSGLVLSIVFCVVIIILIPTTGRVRPREYIIRPSVICHSWQTFP